MNKEIVTTVTVYVEGSQPGLDQPGFYVRLRDLIVEFVGPAHTLIAIEEEV